MFTDLFLFSLTKDNNWVWGKKRGGEEEGVNSNFQDFRLEKGAAQLHLITENSIFCERVRSECFGD